MVAITGPSGCGKSTLLNIIGLIDDFQNGSYQFDGM
ncbi:ATP-binding cassette domain-containing protein, partial [Streptococcus ruminantium]